MQDKIVFGISEELRQFIEALVEEVVLEGKSFEEHKKHLFRFGEVEGIDSETLENNLMSLFATAEDIKCHDATLKLAVLPDISGWSKTFLEQIRVAYCRKDIAFLGNVFNPNSLIITGAYIKGENIRYRSQRKQQYMANLRYVFAKNNNIDVTFETDKMTGVLYESADGKCQIVRLIQNWRSDDYADKGYISFLIYSSQGGPKVYLRAWQPLRTK